MFRKILSVIFAIFMFLPNAHSAEMVNVEYIHQYLNTRWGIDLPRNPLTNPYAAANMKYLLTVVDIANEYLNGDKTTDYGNSEYATLAAADTVATNTAIDTLISVSTFTITTTPGTSSFGMIIGAAGNFTIDWGDGQSDVITDKPTGATTYSHTYTTSGEYEIKLTGRATDYSDAAVDPDSLAGLVPTFALTDMVGGSVMATNVAKISGSLGKIFPTMDDGTNPNFFGTFAMAPITEIPADLFAGIQGAPAEFMFYGTFAYAPITEIPADLFAGIQGAPAMGVFSGTFSYTAITEIPAYLFGNLTGNGAIGMFSGTFSDCANLTTVDGPLFSGTLTPAEGMFASMFSGSGITSIPENIFGELTGDGAPSMFERTFDDCPNLTTVEGPLFSGTITPAESMFNQMFRNSGITSVPENIFGNLTGDGALSMFWNTFSGCTNLTTVGGPLFSGTLTPVERMFAEMFSGSGITSVPANLFGNLTGDGAPQMFYQTFSGCANLTTVGGPLFSGTLTPAERMFYNMFVNSGITSVPENIFGNLTGDGALSMFRGAFLYCTDLTTVGGPLFSGTITPAERMFEMTFYDTAITEIPDGLFAGIQGAPAESMFDSTFYDTDITEIPADLFAGIQGAPAVWMFGGTFRDCAQLQSVPENLFAGIQGAPAVGMFYQTFYRSGITEIPDGLFAGIQGAPAIRMFEATFYNCAQLQSIPENLFGNISGPAASSMFGNTFSSCTSLTGPSARINGQYLYEIWPNGSNMYTYTGSTGLSDYAQIPNQWK